jgi:hypothetical protein
MEEQMRTELEATAFRRLVEHLRKRTDLQNIDLMELAGFCRNCQAAAAKGLSISKEDAREIIYGMPYETWRASFQKDPKKAAEHSS